jgi:DNA recombination protein RmuC
MSAYVQAIECSDPAERRTKMREHVSSIKNHIREMARRNYPGIPEFAPTLPYTVIFLPNESLFYSAMEADGELLSFAEEQRVILATPLSLIAFLRVVACGWTQVTVNLNAHEIQNVAHTLQERLAAFMSDVAAVGEGLEGAVQSFNRAVGRRRNMEASFRKLRELGVGDGEQCTSVTEIDEEIRSFTPTPGHVSRIS